MLIEALRTNSVLTKLNLSGYEWNEWIKKKENEREWTDCALFNPGARMISEVLKCNSTLAILNLRSDKRMRR